MVNNYGACSKGSYLGMHFLLAYTIKDRPRYGERGLPYTYRVGVWLQMQSIEQGCLPGLVSSVVQVTHPQDLHHVISFV